MVRIHEIKLRADLPKEKLILKAEARLGLSRGVLEDIRIVKESIDAREKPIIYRVFSLDILCDIPDEELLSIAKDRKVKAGIVRSEKYEFPPVERAFSSRPVVAGFGPCGIFAALTLAKYGLKPIVIERGSCMEKRIKAVEDFWNGGIFDPNTNVQFGEGGAGSFSDGKLTTGTRDNAQSFVLDEFVKAGANPNIKYKQKPHIGSEVLRSVVVELRKEIEDLGGEVWFDTKLEDIDIKNGKLVGIFCSKSCVNGAASDVFSEETVSYKKISPVFSAASSDYKAKTPKACKAVFNDANPMDLSLKNTPSDKTNAAEHGEAARSFDSADSDLFYLKTDTLIFGLGHSARDSFSRLYDEGLMMEQKQFSMGVRIEHPQSIIDFSQYAADSESLGLMPAEYKLSAKTKKGRGVYSFCMCPGGYVVAASSERGGLVTNGMSNSKRDASNANSGILVDVLPSDFESDHPLAGIEFQRKYERLAFELGGCSYRAPSERLGSFLSGASADACGAEGFFDKGPMGAFSELKPSYKPGVIYCKIEKCLPDFVCEALKEAIPGFGKKIKGFDHPLAILTAPETRSSSPVRIRRDELGRALKTDGSFVEGLYPAGEGAGYAGGIMSAAVDGIHAAEKAAMKR